MRMILIACCMFFSSFLLHSPRHVQEGNLVLHKITLEAVAYCSQNAM